MNYYDKLLQSGFLSKASEELEEARVVIDYQIDEYSNSNYEDLWHFDSKTKEEEFAWIMHEVEAYDVLREEYMCETSQDIFAIRGDEAGAEFTLMFSKSDEIMKSVKDQTFTYSGKFPYYFTSFKLDSQQLYAILYTNFLEFPGFNLN